MWQLGIMIKLSALGLAAFIAGCIDTIAGGGGLICVPALMLAGFSPAEVLATNKLQACFGTGTASYQFMRHGNISLREVAYGSGCCLIGASIGTLTIQRLDPHFLKQVLPFLLLAVLIYMLFCPKAGTMERHAYLKPRLFFLIFGLGLGFYDGFFGPGTGSFWTVALITLLGWNLKQATMHAKVYNFISNLVSLAWFILGGHVLWIVGIVMALGQFFGAKLGAYLVIHKGTRLIRPLFITMVSIMLLTLLYPHLLRTWQSVTA